jgi:hypothetical protein
LARCKPVTTGQFSSKRIVDVKWIGNDKFAEVLQADTGLTVMLKEVMEKAGEITVDPQENQIRIFGSGFMRSILRSIRLCWKLQTG